MGYELNEFQICAKIRSSKNGLLFKSEPQSKFNSCRLEPVCCKKQQKKSQPRNWFGK